MNRAASAIHEAGHAVVATALECDVEMVGLVRDGGRTWWAGSVDPRTAAVVALAGDLSEARYRGISRGSGGDHDLDRAKAAARRAVPEAGVSDWLAVRALEAERILDARWGAVESVASRLRGRPMSGQEVFDIVRAHEPRTGWKVTPWPLSPKQRVRMELPA